MHKKKSHPIFKALILGIAIILPLFDVVFENIVLRLAIVYSAILIIWVFFSYYIRLCDFYKNEIKEQGESVEDILKLAYNKCMDARAANRAKSVFLAQMSHEIRTPINAVLGMNEMILRESKDKAILDYASNAYTAGKTLLSTINDILDISKIEAGRLEIIENEYELYSLISDCFHIVVDRAEKKNLKFTYTVNKNIPSKLYGDMFHIRQIATNFLSNAIKYTNKGFVELSFSGAVVEDKFELQISVKDSGIGLTKENIRNVFVSFQRFDLKRNQSIEGTGLGLAICKQLADLMGGVIDVESEYGVGSTFTLTIPQKIVNHHPIGNLVLNHNPKRESIERPKDFTAPRAKLLVVDDVDMNILVISNVLKSHKLIIDKALSGKECLEKIRNEKYDIIFMDYMMPEMDGMETYERMKIGEHVNRETPVIMLTANAISGEKEKYMDAGLTYYLTKPIQSNLLEETLLRFLPKEKIIFKETETQSTPSEPSTTINESDKYIDTNLGISYLGGSKESYLEVLENFVNNGPEHLGKISECYKNGDVKNYTIHVHALKSASLTIGAKRLSEKAQETEKKCKEGDTQFIGQHNSALLKLYDQVLILAKQILEKERFQSVNIPCAKKPIEKDKLEIFLAQMQDAAERFDSDEIVSICNALSDFAYKGINLSHKIKPIIDAAQDFECGLAYEKAKAIINELLAS